MQLIAIQVDNYRSIRSQQVTDLGPFNVFIGKNNSGKSNLFVGIEEFFRAISGESVIKLGGNVGGKIDFHKQDPRLPLSVQCTFALDDAARREIAAQISTELPQLNAAAEGLVLLANLVVAVRFFPDPERCAAVVKIELADRTQTATQRTIFELDEAAVSELQHRQASLSAATVSRRALDLMLTRMDAVWRDLKELSESRVQSDGARQVRDRLSRDRVRYVVRRYLAQSTDEALATNSESFTLLESILSKDRSREDLELAMRDEIDVQTETIDRLARERLRAAITTFAGVDHKVPEYLLYFKKAI